MAEVEAEAIPRACKDGYPCHPHCETGACFLEKYWVPVVGSGLDRKWQWIEKVEEEV